MSQSFNSEALASLKASVDPDCYQAICDGFEDENPVLIDALPALGKSRGLILWAAETGNPLTIYTLRHDLYRQFEEACEEVGLRYKRIPSQLADCPLGKHYEVTHGETGHEDADLYEDVLKNAYAKYGSTVVAHKRLGRKLPCQETGPCPFVEAHEDFREALHGDSEADDTSPFDVLIGNYLHSYATFHGHSEFEDGMPGLYTADRYVAFDEFPGDAAYQKIDSDDFKESITAYLSTAQHHSGEPYLPYNSYNELNDAARLDAQNEHIETWAESWKPDDAFKTEFADIVSGMSPLASLFTLIQISWGGSLPNGWKRTEIEGGHIAVKDENGKFVWLLRRPSLDLAKSVIALDGTPTPAMWDVLIPGIRHREVLAGDEAKRTHLTERLGLRIVQTTPKIRPYARGYQFEEERPEEPVTPETAIKDILTFRWIIERESPDVLPGIISTKAALEVYQEAGLDDIVSESEHYNNLIGMNDFAEHRLGIVSGCNYPGDDVVKMWAALAGYSVEAKKNKANKRIGGENLTFGPIGDSFLHGLRENDVLQAVMRFGRTESNGEKGATVYVHTSAIPAWVEPEKSFPRVRFWGKSTGATQVLTILKSHVEDLPEPWTVKQLHERIKEVYGDDAFSERTVQRQLTEFSEFGLLTSERPTGEGSGRGRAFQYRGYNPDVLLTYESAYLLPPP